MGRMEKSRYERVVLPAAAYKMSLTTNQVTENIVVKTVVDLMKVYHRQGLERGQAIERIAEKTCLNRLLVKAILKRNENNTDLETGEQNEGATQAFYYLLYDLISGRTFPELIPVEVFEEGARLASVNPPVVDPLNGKEPLLRFQTGMSEKRQNAWILHPGGMEETVFAAPLEPPVSRSMERQYCQNGNGVLRYLGIVEPVGLICTCYLSDREIGRASCRERV